MRCGSPSKQGATHTSRGGWRRSCTRTRRARSRERLRARAAVKTRSVSSEMAVRAAALTTLLAFAPLQCPTPQHPATAREEGPADALWALANQFGTENNAQARDRTLRFLIDRYPNSRYAERARIVIAGGDAGP